MKNITKIVATFFYSGYLPIFPGTWASFFTLFLGYYFLQTEYVLNYVFLIYFLFTIGIWSATEFDRINKTKDSKHIVIDEVVGQLITLLPLFWLGKAKIIYYVLGLVLFRFFDISKILGVDVMQKIPRGLGVMLDDVLAGIYSGVILCGITFII